MSNPRKSASSPLIHPRPTPFGPPPPYTSITTPQDSSENDEEDGQRPIYTSWGRGGTSPKPVAGTVLACTPGLRSRTTGAAVKTISTAPGQLCAGDTETEADEPSRRLPTARFVSSSAPLIPPNSLQQRLTPLLFNFSRLLSIVPAVVGTLYNLYHIYYPSPPLERIDYIVSALWAILTGYQCLALTTGLLTRWRLYYPPLSTLIRLLALQGICWPATQITLSLFEHEKRPVVVWALIGTTTCASRSVQIWVTSNLWWDGVGDGDASRPAVGGGGCGGGGGGVGGSTEDQGPAAARRGYWRRWGGKWGGRRWDWKEVSIKCVLPAGVMYFVMAWAEQLRREWELGRSC